MIYYIFEKPEQFTTALEAKERIEELCDEGKTILIGNSQDAEESVTSIEFKEFDNPDAARDEIDELADGEKPKEESEESGE